MRVLSVLLAGMCVLLLTGCLGIISGVLDAADPEPDAAIESNAAAEAGTAAEPDTTQGHVSGPWIVGWEEARENSGRFALSRSNVVGVQQDGTVVKGYYEYSMIDSDVLSWNGIVQVCSVFGGDYIAGLKSDGTVLLSGRFAEEHYSEDVAMLTGVTRISGGRNHLAAFTEDGTAVVIRKHGTLSASLVNGEVIRQEEAPKRFEGFSDVFSVDNMILAKTAEGVLELAEGLPYYFDRTGGSSETVYYDIDFAGWGDAVSVTEGMLAGWYYVLRADGSVLSVTPERTDVYLESGIAQIADGGRWLIALRTDGTVYYYDTISWFGKELHSWEGIVAINSLGANVVGMRPDGTFTHATSDSGSSIDLSGWRLIAR